MNRTRMIKLVAPLVGLTLALSACGSGAETASPPTQATVKGISTQHDDADVTFIKDMSPHHSGAIAMADLAPTRAANAGVKAIAAEIAGAQGPELARMKDMAEAWGVGPLAGAGPGVASPGMGGSGMASPGMGGPGMGGSGMSGSMGEGDDAAALRPLMGAAFDREFLTRMIAHHSSAVTMSQAELAAGQNAQAKELAQQVITGQQAEITRMKALLTQV